MANKKLTGDEAKALGFDPLEYEPGYLGTIKPYIPKPQLLQHCLEISEDYDGDLTLRQLYYRFIGLGLYKPNRNVKKDGDKFYTRLKVLLSEARKAGAYPLDWMVDRTRIAQMGKYTEHQTDFDASLSEAEDVIRNLPIYSVYSDRWYGQETYVVVGVEKDAMAGVFMRPCKDAGVGLFVFKGYTSIASLYQFAQNIASVGLRKVVLLYFGDHDPEGFQIPESAEANMNTIFDLMGLTVDFRVERVGLTMEQIKQYDPPPFEAKTGSTRFITYAEQQGTTKAWELDSLDVKVLRRLIRDSVANHFDQSIYDANRTAVLEGRQALVEHMLEDDWVAGILEDEYTDEDGNAFYDG